MAQATIMNETKDDEESWATVSDTPDLEPVGHGSEDHWLLERDDMLEVKETFAATAAKHADLCARLAATVGAAAPATPGAPGSTSAASSEATTAPASSSKSSRAHP